MSIREPQKALEQGKALIQMPLHPPEFEELLRQHPDERKCGTTSVWTFGHSLQREFRALTKGLA